MNASSPTPNASPNTSPNLSPNPASTTASNASPIARRTSATAAAPSVSVVICAYTERRWDDLLGAIESVRTQAHTPREILVVIDHNPALAARLRELLNSGSSNELTGNDDVDSETVDNKVDNETLDTETVDIKVLENYGQRGLSGARNTALAECVSEVVAFLDDDARARPGWLDRMLTHYADPRVVAVGGAATPNWPDERPVTLPAGGHRGAGPVRGELDWVVGCTYTGQPRVAAEVRNLMGCSMSFRRSVFFTVGGFSENIGRIGTVPLGCEETELCIRIRKADPAARIVFEPASLISHRVSADRLTWKYLRSRSYAEGLSKAAVSTMVGAEHALSTERAYTSKIIPAAVLRELGRALLGRRAGLYGAAALVLSVLFAGLGYARGSVSVRTTLRGQLGGRADVPGADGPAPVALGELDLAEQRTVGADPHAVRLLPVSRGRAEYARVLLRHGSHVFGETEIRVRDGVPDADALAAAVRALPAIPEDIPEDQPRRGTVPMISVVIASAGRPHPALRAAKSVLATGYPRLEVLVVDNRPDSPNSAILRDFVRTDARLRYLAEPNKGASNARNRGAAEAFGEIIAFTDDDAVVDRHWLDALITEFADPAVDCVTGLVLPLSLDTAAQQWFESWGGFSKGYHRRRLTSAGVSGQIQPDWTGRLALYPFAAGMFGSGNNMAWRAGSYRALGGCDPLLGPGSATASGEDLELFIRLVRGDGVLVYTPHAVVRHEHRKDMRELVKQMHSYGRGLIPMFAVYIGRRPWELAPIAQRLPKGVRHLLAGDSERNAGRGDQFPPELARAELRGLVSGPFRLLFGLVSAPRRRLGLPEAQATVALRAAEPALPALTGISGATRGSQ